LLDPSRDSRRRSPLTASSDKPSTGFGNARVAGRCPKRQRQLGAGPYVTIPQWRYQSPIALERQHIEHGTHDPERSTIHHFHGNLGTAHTLARKVRQAVAGGGLQHAIEGCARQAIQSTFPIKQEMSERHAHGSWPS
jgi:hypothetical protein